LAFSGFLTHLNPVSSTNARDDWGRIAICEAFGYALFHDPGEIDVELPEVWRLIAEADSDHGLMRWYTIAGAQITVSEARKLHEEGLILMAQQRQPSGRMGLLIKLAKKTR
jgi:hypothetical protein